MHPRASGDELRIDGASRPLTWPPSHRRLDVSNAVIISVDDVVGGMVRLDPAGYDFKNVPSADVRDVQGCVLAPLPVRVKLPLGEGWATLACGELHSAALTTSGEAYTWGCAEAGG